MPWERVGLFLALPELLMTQHRGLNMQGSGPCVTISGTGHAAWSPFSRKGLPHPGGSPFVEENVTLDLLQVYSLNSLGS